jgi:hypothetical protein
MDLTKVAKTTLGAIGALFKRGQPASHYAQDDWPEIPAPYKGGDELRYRIATGMIQPDVPKRHKLETRGPEAMEVKWRDGPG